MVDFIDCIISINSLGIFLFDSWILQIYKLLLFIILMLLFDPYMNLNHMEAKKYMSKIMQAYLIILIKCYLTWLIDKNCYQNPLVVACNTAMPTDSLSCYHIRKHYIANTRMSLALLLANPWHLNRNGECRVLRALIL